MSKPGGLKRPDEPVKVPKGPHKALPSVQGFHDHGFGHYYEPERPPIKYQFTGSDRPGVGRIEPQLVTVPSRPQRIFVPFNKQYTPVLASVPINPVRIKSGDGSFVESYSVPRRHYRFWPPVAGSQDVPKDKKGKDAWFASGKLEPLDKDPQPLPPKKKPSSRSKMPSPALGKKSHQETLSETTAKQPAAETLKNQNKASSGAGKQPAKITATKLPDKPGSGSGLRRLSGSGKGGPDSGSGSGPGKGGTGSKVGKPEVTIEKPFQEVAPKPIDRKKFPLSAHQSLPYHPYSPSSRGGKSGSPGTVGQSGSRVPSDTYGPGGPRGPKTGPLGPKSGSPSSSGSGGSGPNDGRSPTSVIVVPISSSGSIRSSPTTTRRINVTVQGSDDDNRSMASIESVGNSPLGRRYPLRNRGGRGTPYDGQFGPPLTRSRSQRGGSDQEPVRATTTTRRITRRRRTVRSITKYE